MFKLKGAYFSEYFKRRSARLALEWNVTKYTNNEPDLPEYTKRKKLIEFKIKNRNAFMSYLIYHDSYIKMFVSLLILLLMV